MSVSFIISMRSLISSIFMGFPLSQAAVGSNYLGLAFPLHAARFPPSGQSGWTCHLYRLPIRFEVWNSLLLHRGGVDDGDPIQIHPGDPRDHIADLSGILSI